MVKRKRVSVSWSRGTVRQHQGISGPSREKTRPAPGPTGPTRENTRPAPGPSGPTREKNSPSTRSIGTLARKNSPSTPSTAIFRPFFPRWANYFAFAFTSDRTGRTFSRPEHRDVITVKPTASLNARPGTKLSQHAALHALSGTKLSQHAKKRPFLPKMSQQGEFCSAR